MSQKGDSNNDPNNETGLVKWFSELNKDSESIAGKKGADLSEIYNLKLPVTPGFVITVPSYDYFIENSGLKNLIKGQLEKINYQDTNLLNDISEVIRNNIIEAKMPTDLEEEIIEAYENLSASDLSEVHGSALDILHNAHEPIFVAVRSSATQENLGEKQESFLNIKGMHKLIEYVKRCFASLFTPQAIISRNEKGLEDYPQGIAVIVQRMVDSGKSGIIFSKNPNQKDENIIIKSIWGLGEGTSFQEINPDEYIVNKDIEIVDIKIGEKEIAISRDSSGNKTAIKLREEKSKQQVLTRNEVIQLSQLALQLEEHYKEPQEIEFAIEGNEIYLVQTKPTTIEKEIETNEDRTEENIPEKILPEDETTKPKDEEESSEEVYKKLENIYMDEIEKVTTKTRTKIKLIVDLPKFAETSSETNIKSVGLTRIEGIISESGKHPNYFLENGNIKEYEEILFEGINNISKYFNEIWVRTSDIRSDELSNLKGSQIEKEANPKMGLHGIRFSLKNPKILEAELNSLKRISETGKKVGIILPNVTLVEEVKKVKEMLNTINFNNAKIGIIIETPSAIQTISQLCDEGIDFIIFGINSLAENILTLDKENPKTKELYNEMHPAVLYQISYVIRVCKRRNVESNIYIENKINKEMIKFLIENGINSISVDSNYANELANQVKELEDTLIKGTDKEPRKYVPKENPEEEEIHIKGVEKLHAKQDRE
jgi:phosphoenolpyruvate synthase/pyruvate phosphate dikinase